MRLVDEGPLLAKVLGVSLGDTDGRVPGGLLREDLGALWLRFAENVNKRDGIRQF